MICKQCGENLPDNARVCDTCGARVVHSVPVPTEPAEAVPVSLESNATISAGEYFKNVFSSKNFHSLAILLTVTTAFTVLAGIAMAVLKFLGQSDSDFGIAQIAGIVLNVFLTLLVWKLYRFAATVTEPKGRDFRPFLKWCRYYTVLHLGVTVASALIDIIIVAIASGLTFSVIGTTVLSTVISILPIYAAYKLACSLETSAINEHVILEGVGMLNIFLIIAMIYYLWEIVSYIVLCFVHWIFIIVIIQSIINAFLIIRIRDWLLSINKGL